MTLGLLPKSGPEFLVWKTSTCSRVVFAANRRETRYVVLYIEKAFDTKANPEELNDIPEDLQGIDIELAQQMQQRVQDLIRQNSQEKTHMQTALVTKLTDLNYKAACEGLLAVGGRNWINVVARHYEGMAPIESDKAEFDLKHLRCADTSELGQKMIQWDEQVRFVNATDQRKKTLFIDAFEGVKPVYEAYLHMGSSATYYDIHRAATNMVSAMEHRPSNAPKKPETVGGGAYPVVERLGGPTGGRSEPGPEVPPQGREQKWFDWWNCPLTSELQKEKDDLPTMSRDFCLDFQESPIGLGKRFPDPNAPTKYTCGRKNCKRVHEEVPAEEQEKAKRISEYLNKERQHKNLKKAEFYASQGGGKDDLYFADEQGKGGWSSWKGPNEKGSGKGGKKGKGSK